MKSKVILPKRVYVAYGNGSIKPRISVDHELINEVPVNEVLTPSRRLAFQILATMMTWQDAWNYHRRFVARVMIPALQEQHPELKEDLIEQDPISVLLNAKAPLHIEFTCDLTKLFPENCFAPDLIGDIPDNGDWSRVFHKVGVDSLVTMHNNKRFVQGKKYRLMIARNPIKDMSIDHPSGYRHAIEAWLTPDNMYAIWRGLNRIYAVAP